MSEIIKTAETALDSLFNHAWKIERRIEEDPDGLKEDILSMISEIQTEASRIEDSLEKVSAQLHEVKAPDPRSVEMWLEDLNALTCTDSSGRDRLSRTERLSIEQMYTYINQFRT
jgi:hypothetical protein